MPKGERLSDSASVLLSQHDLQTVLGPLDAAADYLRLRLVPLTLGYLLAMLPYSLGMLVMIDAVSAQHRTGVTLAAGLLTGASFIRWLGQARLQSWMIRDLGGVVHTPLRRCWMGILLSRLVANLLITIGSLLIFPAYFGLYAGALAAPLGLRQRVPGRLNLFLCLRQLALNFDRLSRVLLVINLLALLLLASAALLQGLLLYTLLPSLLGLEVSDLMITLGGWPWLITAGYLLFLVLDLYWTVLGVILAESLQQRREGADLAARLTQLEAEASS